MCHPYIESGTALSDYIYISKVHALLISFYVAKCGRFVKPDYFMDYFAQ